MERSWLAGARWSECDLGPFCSVIPSFGSLLQRPALIWGPLAARRRRSAAFSVIYVGASSHVGPGRRRRPVGRGARGRIFAARARGCARLGASRPSGRSTRRRGPRRPREGLLSWPRRPPPLLVRQGASRLARLRRSTGEVKNTVGAEQSAATIKQNTANCCKMRQQYSKIIVKTLRKHCKNTAKPEQKHSKMTPNTCG